jgi:hypothetical protein
MEIMTRPEFAALPGEQHLEACIILDPSRRQGWECVKVPYLGWFFDEIA